MAQKTTATTMYTEHNDIQQDIVSVIDKEGIRVKATDIFMDYLYDYAKITDEKFMSKSLKALRNYVLYCFEDVTVVKGFEYGKVPNKKEPELERIRYATGEEGEVDYAIRFAAGLGSQVVYLLQTNEKLGRDRKGSKHEEWQSNIENY